MAQHTTRLNLNYPQSTDPANPPSDFQSIANTLDNEVVGFVKASSTAAPANPYVGLIWFQTDTMNIYYYAGASFGWMPISMYYAPSTGTTPNPTLPGMFWYQTDTNQLLVYNGSQWIESVPAIMKPSTAPPTPAYSGMIWYQTDTKMMKVYDGTLAIPAWVTPSSLIYYNATQPTSASQGQLWYDSNSQTIKVYTGSSWQPAASNPPGAVIDYAGTITFVSGSSGPLSKPLGYMVCDGSAISRSTYANLYAAIGTTWGGGDGTTTFNLPNLQGRVSVGVGTPGSNNSSTFGSSPGGSNISLAQTSGEQIHQLSISEMPSHNHPWNDANHTHGIEAVAEYGTLGAFNSYSMAGIPPGNTTFNTYNNNTVVGSVGYNGSSAYHNNTQPFAGLYKLIKY